MTWIKISEGVYAKEASPDPAEVVRLDDLQKQIAELQSQIDSLNSQLLEYPDGADDRLKEAIDLWNAQNIEPILSLKESELSEKERLLSEIENG